MRCPHLQYGGITTSPDSNSDGCNADYVSSRTSAPVDAGLRVQRQINDCRGTELSCGVKTQRQRLVFSFPYEAAVQNRRGMEGEVQRR